VEAEPAKRADADRYWREVLVPRIEAARAERERALIGREDLVSRVEALLFHHDPIGLDFGTNTDEYRAEAQTIVLRLDGATDERSVLKVVHEEFVRWFGASTAGPVESYRAVAADLWLLWTRGPGTVKPKPAESGDVLCRRFVEFRHRATSRSS
jgi:hypothetical protein